MPLTVVRGMTLVAVLVFAAPLRAQELTPGPPGPFVVDVRGSTVGVPNDPAFFPVLPSGTSVPARAFGADFGAHLYPLAVGAARLGLGVNVLLARGSVAASDQSTSDVSTRLTAIAPQVSLNFGTRNGWSHLSVGYGTVSIRSEAPVTTSSVTAAGTGETAGASTGGVAESGDRPALNFGGGARWFLSRHFAIGFDIRIYRVSAGGQADTPGTSLVAASVGLSLK